MAKIIIRNTILLSGLLGLLSLPEVSAQAPRPNIALNKPVTASSEAPGYPARNAVDGSISREAAWQTPPGVPPPHVLEIDLQRYYNLQEIRVHTGIPEAERSPAEATQAAGFWSVKHFKLQYWDDANWTDIPRSETTENRLTTVPFTFSPAITTFKIRFVSVDGEPLRVLEIEAFGQEVPNMPVPSPVASDLGRAPQIKNNQAATVTISSKVVGTSMKYVGYNQGYYLPGTNVSDWLRYSHVNSLRVWTSLNTYVPLSAVQVDPGLASLEEFDKRKQELRANPEQNRFLKWEALYPLYNKPEEGATNPMVFDYVLAELKRLKLAGLLQINNRDFTDSWANKWQQWQRFYALAYYAAKNGDVAMFAMQNEPNHAHSGPMKIEEWVGGMQIVSDAVRCAVEDVNRGHGKQLRAKFVGPVTAGTNTDWWAAVARHARTDYRGNQLDHDLVDLFSTHSYNSPAAGYASRVANVQKTITDNHPAHQPIPVVFTEIGRWMNAYLIDKEETMDSPSLFTEWAGIYTNNMKDQAYGMWAFKFANTTSSAYPRGIKSGHHLTWQGQRVVEDAYTNLAQGKTVKASSEAAGFPARHVTDGDKSDRSTWQSADSSGEKWLEIDLGEQQELGSAVVYTGSAYGVYTGPDRVKNFRLQYLDQGTWKDVPGGAEKNGKYVQVFLAFGQPVRTTKVRFVSPDEGAIKVREIKLFASGDGPSAEQNYNVAGVHRTGEVVRLFAKGFKEERDLLETRPSVQNTSLDACTSYDPGTGNYYVWLVQRAGFDYHLSLDLAALPAHPGAPIQAETVGPRHHGEVTHLLPLPEGKRINLILPAQSVMLLTIPGRGKLVQQTFTPAADAMVAGGKYARKNFGRAKEMAVTLDAANPAQNKVTYLHFDLANIDPRKASRVILSAHGHLVSGDAPFRFHVYAIPSAGWDQRRLTWQNAPQLDAREALVLEAGRKAFLAGQLAMGREKQYHHLDVTELVREHGGQGITFVLVRETRHLGDDEDKGSQALIGSRESRNPPRLELWLEQDDVTGSR